MRFNIPDLQVFVNVVNAGNITGGAERSNRTVAAVSLRLKEMEAAVGVALLDRERRGVRPTEAGHKLMRHAYRVLKDVQEMQDELSDYGKHARNFVNISCNSLALQEILPMAIGDLLVNFPSAQVRVDDLVNDQVARAVFDRRAEIGIMAEPVDHMGLEILEFLEDRYVVVAPPDWDYCQHSECRFAELLNHEFVGPGRGTWMHLLLQQHAEESGKSFRSRALIRNFSMHVGLASRGVGISIVPGLVAKRMRPLMPFRTINLNEPWASLRMVLCVRRRNELSADASRLLEHLIAAGSAIQATT
jgi:DNA-binding transcriptional LysR family regulator